MDADKIYIDEMAFVPYTLIQEVIAPMLKMKNSVVVSASTQLDKSNHFSKFFTDEYKKSAKIDHLVVTMQTDLLCRECRESGAAAFECTHGDYKHPAFNIAGNKERAAVFIADQHNFAREMMGAVTGNAVSVIKDSDIEALQNRAMDFLVDLDPQQTTVWTYIDPNGGAQLIKRHNAPPSKLGMCSIIRRGKQKIIVALHSQQAVGELDTLTQVTQYFASLAKNPLLAHCRHVMFVENNFGGTLTADYFYNRAMRQIPNIQPVNWFSDFPGVKKTRKNTSAGVMTLIIDMAESNLSFYHYMCGASPESIREAMNDFFRQLGRLHKVLHPDGQYSYSAKKDGECDDALVAMYMTSYFSFHVLQMAHHEQYNVSNLAMHGITGRDEYQ